MGKKKRYSTKKLIKLYRKKTKELGHIPKAKEIDNDPRMPAYITFLRKFGTEREIIKKANLAPKYRKKVRINNQFCNDCLYDPRNCGCEIEDCKESAKLYFHFLGEKVNH